MGTRWNCRAGPPLSSDSVPLNMPPKRPFWGAAQGHAKRFDQKRDRQLLERPPITCLASLLALLSVRISPEPKLSRRRAEAGTAARKVWTTPQAQQAGTFIDRAGNR